MKFKIILYPVFTLFMICSLGFTLPDISLKTKNTLSTLPGKSTNDIKLNSTAYSIKNKYNECNLAAAAISENLFNYAIKGYEYLVKRNKLTNTRYITIVDFSKPSSQKRLYVIDVVSGDIIFNTLVAHGMNSGKIYAKAFSNKQSSLESSLGFYVTSDTYIGKNGYSLKLNGCEKGFNDKALERGIVIHGAEYVSEPFINQNGYLGRSHGCPALPEELSNKIIDVIKNGSCLFIYSPIKKYLSRSAILNG